MELTPAAVTFIIALAGILAVLSAILWFLERTKRRQDELEQFRRTIEAMRRMEQQDGDR